MSEEELGRQQYIRTVMDARLNVRDAIAQGSALLSPDRALRPVEEVSKAKRVHVRMHTTLFDYYDQIRPFREDLGDRWEQPIAEISYPAPHEPEPPRPAGGGKVVSGEPIPAQAVGPRQEERKNIVSGALALSNLDAVRYKHIRTSEKYKDGARGIQRRFTDHRVLIPLSAATLINAELNDCVKELGLAFIIQPTDAHADTVM